MPEKLVGEVSVTGDDLSVSFSEIKGGEIDGSLILIIHSNPDKPITQWLCVTEQSADVVIQILEKFKRVIKLREKEIEDQS